MIRGSDLLDLPIFDSKENKKIAYLNSFLLNLYTRKIEALTVKKNMLTNNIIYIPVYNISQISRDKLTTKFETISKSNKYNIDSKQYINYHQIINKTIIDYNENILGIVRDIWINEITWEYLAYEISEGYFDDFMSGRKLMYSNQEYMVEENNLYLYKNSFVASYDNFLIDKF